MEQRECPKHTESWWQKGWKISSKQRTVASKDAGETTDMSDVLKLMHFSGEENEVSVDMVLVQEEGNHTD